jgi:hypothetical protein
VNAARLTRGKGSSSWPTVTANEDSYRIGGESQQSKCLSAMARRGEMAQWHTPEAHERTHAPRKCGHGTIPLANQVILGQAAPASSSSLGSRQGLWPTPQAHDAQGPKTPEQIAVMRAKGHGVKNLNEQAQWGTPTARDHKSGRGNEEREYKELTPMVERQQSGKLNPRWVETLMGLPIGWTMPSCIRPVTIEPTSCDYSETALCLPAQSERSDFLLAS